MPPQGALTATGDLPPETWRLRNPALARFLNRKLAVFALGMILFILLAALLGPFVWPHNYYDPVRMEWIGNPQPPSWAHPAGIDVQGRDNLARLLIGAQISLAVGIVSMILNLVIGVTVGILAGWCGGKVDTLLMRGVDILYSIPLVLVVILLQLFVNPVLGRMGITSDNVPLLLSPDLLSVYIALGLTNWLTMARLARGEVINQAKRDYVMAARALGLPSWRILIFHVLPNTVGPLAVAATLAIPEAIFIESFLAFIGLGVSAPASSWGSLASDARESLGTAPHLLLFPALCISLTMLAFNLFGDGLQDALDPSQRD